MKDKSDHEKVFNAIPLMVMMGLVISMPILVLAGVALWQRSQINDYLVRVDPIIKKANKRMNTADLMWDRDFFKETYDPLTKGSDPVAVQYDLKEARKELATARKQFNRAEAEFRRIKTPRDGTDIKEDVQDYFETGNKFMMDLDVVLAHFESHAAIEGRMDTAIDNAKLSGSDAEAAAIRDGTLEQELNNLQAMSVPGPLHAFHEHKEAWFAKLLVLLKDSTAAAAVKDNNRLDQIGIEIEELAATGDVQFKQDLDDIRNGDLSNEDDMTTELKADLEQEFLLTKLKYRL